MKVARKLQYTFRSLLLITTAVGVWLGCSVRSHQLQMTTLKQLEERCLLVHVTWANSRWAPPWLEPKEGALFARVDSLVLIDEQITSAELETVIKDLSTLKEVIVLPSSIDAEEYRQLEEKFTDIEFSSLGYDDSGSGADLWAAGDVRPVETSVLLGPGDGGASELRTRIIDMLNADFEEGAKSSDSKDD